MASDNGYKDGRFTFKEIHKYLVQGVQGRIQDLGKGGGLINIFTTGGGYGRGRAPSRDSKGVCNLVPSLHSQ